MRFIFASDSFKGSLSSEKANDTLERAARDVFGSIESKKIEIADGGEGTLEAIQASDSGYEEVWMTVSGPLGEPTKAFYIRKGVYHAYIKRTHFKYNKKAKTVSSL